MPRPYCYGEVQIRGYKEGKHTGEIMRKSSHEKGGAERGEAQRFILRAGTLIIVR